MGSVLALCRVTLFARELLVQLSHSLMTKAKHGGGDQLKRRCHTDRAATSWLFFVSSLWRLRTAVIVNNFLIPRAFLARCMLVLTNFFPVFQLQWHFWHSFHYFQNNNISNRLLLNQLNLKLFQISSRKTRCSRCANKPALILLASPSPRDVLCEEMAIQLRRQVVFRNTCRGGRHFVEVANQPSISVHQYQAAFKNCD